MLFDANVYNTLRNDTLTKAVNLLNFVMCQYNRKTTISPSIEQANMQCDRFKFGIILVTSTTTGQEVQRSNDRIVTINKKKTFKHSK